MVVKILLGRKKSPKYAENPIAGDRIVTFLLSSVQELCAIDFERLRQRDFIDQKKFDWERVVTGVPLASRI